MRFDKKIFYFIVYCVLLFNVTIIRLLKIILIYHMQNLKSTIIF